ncbi:MAG: sigma-70 family RNA polymerase sigma factor [Acidobacteria bacterium]|nr:sigma-70 family RNA polymerase sigma factor [Acidobacteriota bacterium]
MTLTVNAARTVATRSASRREDALEDLSPPTTPNDGPHAPIEAADVRRAVLSAAGELTERERLVFLLRDVQGLDAATVGEALGITAVTVRRLSGNARAKVIEWLRRHRPELLLGRPGAATVDPEECGEKSPPL